MEEVIAEPGQAIITEGEKGDTLYIIDEGEYDCVKVINGKPTYLKTYKAGDFFG
jgi:CRP-like cAMP-binding protein